MKNIIDWLLNIEKLAGNIYRKAADTFSDNKDFSSFLSGLAEDEDMHYQLLEKAKTRLLQKMIDSKSAIIVDQSTRDKIKVPLQDLYEQIMAAHKVTEHAVMKVILNTEFSELNDVFLYIIHSLYGEDREVQKIFSTIHSHIHRAKDFISKNSHERDLSDVIRGLTFVGERRLLVVENDIATRTMIAHLLEQFGTIETAAGIKEALGKIRNGFYDVVISDTGIPDMNGMEFFQKATEIYPDIGRHFVFCCGDVTPETEAYFKKHDLVYLEKPFNLNQLIKTVRAIIDKA